MGTLLLSLLLTAALVFVGLYFLYKRQNASVNPTSRASYWLIAIIATPTIYAGAIFLWFLSTSSYEAKVFDQEAWAANQETRYEYVDDLIAGKKLIGLTSSELKSMLGKVDHEDDSTLTFYIGYSPKKFMNMAPDWLVAYLKDGVVREVFVEE